MSDQEPKQVTVRDGKFYDEQSRMIDLTTTTGQNIQQAATTQYGSLSEIEGKTLDWNADKHEFASASSR